jgi:PhnB protein
MTKLDSYLNFNGQAEEAFELYRSVFGGEFSSLVRFKDMPMPGATLAEEDASKIMHISLPVGKSTLMASDILESMGMQLNVGNNVHIFIAPDSRQEADRLFSALSAGGEVEMPMAEQVWGDYYGSLRDKFGIQWMINYSQPTNKRELVLSRILNAKRDLVWRAWTEPAQVKSWWGPKTFTAPFAEIDLRPGGKYLYCMRAPDGKDYWSTGTIREVVPQRRLVLTDSFADPQGNVVSAAYYGMNPEFPLESLVMIEFEDENGKTRFTMKYEDVSAIPDQDLAGMQQGWNESFDKLADYLAKISE